MIRTIDMHKCNPNNKEIIIYATSDSDRVACLADKYEIKTTSKNHFIDFQDAGLNIEILIAICLDRLYCLQESQDESINNELAIISLENTLHWLGARSDSRSSYKRYNTI